MRNLLIINENSGRGLHNHTQHDYDVPQANKHSEVPQIAKKLSEAIA